MNDEERFENPESLDTCPFDPSHKLRRCKMAGHLVKCRRQHPEIAKQLMTCPFNSTHQIAPIELPYHESICPDRENFYNYAHRMENGPNRAIDELMKNSRIPIEISSEENWDDEIDPTQDIISTIREQADRRAVLQSNSNLPPAERRIRRQEQRSKWREILNEEDNTSQSSLPSSSGYSTGSSSVVSFSSGYSRTGSGGHSNGSEQNKTRGRERHHPY